MVRVVLILAVLGAVPAHAQTVPDPARTLHIPRVTTPPTLEDYLDGTPRAEEAAVTTFVQREPGDGVPGSQPTEAYLSYDEHHLYVIFIARDSEPDRVRASLTRREGFSNNDSVGLMLDTFQDRRRAYLFIVNPLGVQLDGVTTDGARDDDYTFDTVWASRGRLTPFGYVVWMAIPFKSLRFSSATDQSWGIALTRSINRSNEAVFWPFITRRLSGAVRQLATATGIREISPGRNYQFIPYAAFTGSRFLDVDRPAFETDGDARVGVDSKVVIKDAFTLDLTLNPDFSQVESDEPQVTINQRFEVFFPEKRPFFIENAAYFETPINLFFSRRIADPQLGARLTGKKGGWTVAALAMDDRAPAERLPPADPAHDDRAGIGVLRVQKDLPRQSTIGMIATTSRFASAENHVAAVDGRYSLSDTWVISGQAAVSDARGRAGDARAGAAYSVFLDRTGRNWGAFLQYQDISPDFRAPLGFVNRVDLRRLFPFIRYTWFPGRHGIVSIRPELSGSLLWDHGGTLQDWETSAELQFELKGQTQVEAAYEETMERFGGTEFRKHGASFRFETGWLDWMETSLELERGREINFFPAGGLLPFLADATLADLSLTLKPTARLQLNQRYLFTRLAGRDGTPGVTTGDAIVSNHIWRSRASYQFTRRLSLRAIADYSAVLPDSDLIDLEREKRFTTDVLLTYLFNPWTAVYVGYTDAYGNLEIDPLSGDRLRPTESVFHSTGRQLFVKVSYLLRF
jgi:hypothetical protein